MALEMLAEVKNHEVSHRPTEKVLLRIGIHTGMEYASSIDVNYRPSSII